MKIEAKALLRLLYTLGGCLRGRTHRIAENHRREILVLTRTNTCSKQAGVVDKHL